MGDGGTVSLLTIGHMMAFVSVYDNALRDIETNGIRREV